MASFFWVAATPGEVRAVWAIVTEVFLLPGVCQGPCPPKLSDGFFLVGEVAFFPPSGKHSFLSISI